MSEHILNLLALEEEQLKKLNNIVAEAVEEEKLLINKLNEISEPYTSLGNRVADKVSGFGGSWRFIISFVLFMLIWIFVNSFWFGIHFDPYPFILLNLILSTIAALQAPVILMSQNRKEEKDRQRAINDYLVNLKSEMEVRNIHRKLDLLIRDQMKTLFEIQKVQMDMIKEIKESNITKQWNSFHNQSTDQTT